MSTSERKRGGFSLAGCGFTGIYHIGVCLCIQEHAEEYITSTGTKWFGASAGSLVAVAIACGVNAVEGYKFVQKLHDEIYESSLLGKYGAFHPGFDIMRYFREFLEKHLPPDAHKLCRNRVGVSLTVLPSFTNWIVTDFNTRAELIQAVLCSSHLPLFCGVRTPRFRGKMCCDGGFSNNLPYSCNPNVITVSPFSGECDICPNGETETHALSYVVGQATQFSMANFRRGYGAFMMYPWKHMNQICAQGFQDTFEFFRREGIIPTKLSMWPNSTTNHYKETTAKFFLMNENDDLDNQKNHGNDSVNNRVDCLNTDFIKELIEKLDSVCLQVETDQMDKQGSTNQGIAAHLQWSCNEEIQYTPGSKLYHRTTSM